jgi:hypothetical protein
MNQIHHDVCATSEGNRLSKSAGVVTPLGVQQGEAWVMIWFHERNVANNIYNSIMSLIVKLERSF